MDRPVNKARPGLSPELIQRLLQLSPRLEGYIEQNLRRQEAERGFAGFHALAKFIEARIPPATPPTPTNAVASTSSTLATSSMLATSSTLSMSSTPSASLAPFGAGPSGALTPAQAIALLASGGTNSSSMIARAAARSAATPRLGASPTASRNGALSSRSETARASGPRSTVDNSNSKVPPLRDPDVLKALMEFHRAHQPMVRSRQNAMTAKNLLAPEPPRLSASPKTVVSPSHRRPAGFSSILRVPRGNGSNDESGTDQ